jgi:hypothetical protein
VDTNLNIKQCNKDPQKQQQQQQQQKTTATTTQNTPKPNQNLSVHCL